LENKVYFIKAGMKLGYFCWRHYWSTWNVSFKRVSSI